MLVEAVKENLEDYPTSIAAGKNTSVGKIMDDLDHKTIETYNTVIQEYNNVATKDVADFVTYYRIQGGVKNTELGLSRSQVRIFANEDGSISILKKNKPISISAYTLEHADYYKGTREASASLIAFDVPRWFDDLVRENAVLQKNYSTSAWNQGGTAPKIPDINKPGYPYELPPPWPEWLEEYGYNSRYIK